VQKAHQINPTDLSSSSHSSSIPPSEKTRVKLKSLQDNRSQGQLVCFHCGDHGHLATSCRNAVVCFSCGRLRHRSHQCRSVTMFQASPPKPSAKACAQANALPMLKFYPNPNNKKFRATIQNSLIFHDKLELGTIYIQTYLQKLFPLQGWQWVARALPRNKYLIEPSNVEWCKFVLSKGEIDLGSVQFIVEPYDFQKFDEGSDMVFL
jgi:Zinc knuckle